ncbi:BatA domain-containing protein [Robiginitalea marina]|uniref:BatA domain-containing protein n=1 Tax=Robiginitalea marina TaxID=2954105 RepID=A0ABT1AVM7_9FLAO|nr:BatA domain-containing protein [Robiginitalea marina]MCO5723620.1 BatA domain-containing protein [Robiginitalea marina]
MQFKHPELLWGLLLLLIPILVHLLRLRRFRDTPFTNVRILKKILVEANRSSRLKKWLLLLARLGLIAALVLAFCQPFLSSQTVGKPKDILVYLDNSFSMQVQEGNSSLLQNTVQDLLQFLPEDLRFTLMTQSRTYREVEVRDIQQELLDLGFDPGSTDPAEVQLRADAYFASRDSAERELWLLSDFIGWDREAWASWNNARVRAVRATAGNPVNISLDTAFFGNKNPETLELLVSLSYEGPWQNTPVSLYDGQRLVAKTTAEIQDDGAVLARFLIPAGEGLNGIVQINDNGLPYDNVLYLSHNPPEKIRVLGIGPSPSPYLARIFSPAEFAYAESDLRTLDYGLINRQHLVVLNELEAVPEPLARALQEFSAQGGVLLVIPAADARIESYNTLLAPLGAGLQPRVEGDNPITGIVFDHPRFQGVFEKQVENFEYPRAGLYFPLEGTLPAMLKFQDGQAFLSGIDGLYVCAAPLGDASGNFRFSPLIVPTLYSIGRGSLPGSDLYYQVGKEASLDLDLTLEEDNIVEMRGAEYSFIPLQQSFSRKTRLIFGDEPRLAGNYLIEYQGGPIRQASFNYPRTESLGRDTPAGLPDRFEIYPDVERLVAQYQNSMAITSLWKWFVILALLFVLVETFLQKLMR